MLDAALADRIIEFESGKATLTESGMAILDQMSAVLLKLKNKKVEVIGHTDNSGSRASNLSLSQARAEAVKAYVATKGIDPTRSPYRRRSRPSGSRQPHAGGPRPQPPHRIQSRPIKFPTSGTDHQKRQYCLNSWSDPNVGIVYRAG